MKQENPMASPLKAQWQQSVNWPGYFYTQVHPEDPALQMLKDFSLGIQTEPNYVLHHPEIFKVPAEYPAFSKSLQAAEKSLEGKKLTDLNPKQWEQLFLQINGNAPRKKEFTVANNLKFHAFGEKKKSFTEIDKYFGKTADFEQWKKIRKDVWDFVHLKKNIAFTPETIDLLERHDLMKKLPSPKEAAQQMKKFCQELPQKVKEIENPFELMAYIHQKLVQIHYFSDANGRTARIVMGLVAYQRGMSPLLIEDKTQYLKAASEPDHKPLVKLLEALSQNQEKELAFVKIPQIDAIVKGILLGASA
jgi:hypothetical protein